MPWPSLRSGLDLVRGSDLVGPGPSSFYNLIPPTAMNTKTHEFASRALAEDFLNRGRFELSDNPEDEPEVLGTYQTPDGTKLAHIRALDGANHPDDGGPVIVDIFDDQSLYDDAELHVGYEVVPVPRAEDYDLYDPFYDELYEELDFDDDTLDLIDDLESGEPFVNR